MNLIDFTVDIPPTGKARPRIVNQGGKYHAYNTEKTDAAETAIRNAFRQTDFTFAPKGVAVSLDVVAYYTIPKSYTKEQRKRIERGELHPTKKPDADNILKLIADALNGVAYEDDAQIVNMSIMKEYTKHDEGYLKIIVCVDDGWGAL